MILILSSGSLLAQTVPLSGKIVSRSVSYTITAANHGNAVVYTIPATGSFVLTEFCGTGTTLIDNKFGFIAAPDPNQCVSFSPGFALSNSSQIICSGLEQYLGSIAACSISGVLGP
jgi:hypothetical protein